MVLPQCKTLSVEVALLLKAYIVVVGLFVFRLIKSDRKRN